MDKNLPDDPVRKLVEIMKRLRGPQGCPWDQLQTPQTLKPYLLEEAHEVLHAIDNEGPDEIKNELGDLLLQVVFLAGTYEENRLFSIDDVAEAISEKLIRRHPHVFGDSQERDLARLDRQWDMIKRTEKSRPGQSLVDGIQSDLPALLQAQKVSNKVARAGFDWGDLDGVVGKLDEEMTELKDAVASGNKDEINSEFGDILFTLVNIGRHLDLDCETSLLQMLQRFKSRFRIMEGLITESDQEIDALDIEQLEAFWQQAKQVARQKS